ncbi:lasso RiPP family leader peptide-containing protein [Streptomyces palmae]|uniref:Lasso RiPP family leader peptide-containing protein n=1 Tax=Streptomyces palmae TaxID=1701085 RepID=A0A4Z0GPT1_9ACTN|nr:lasso RiPP family leader peptide-containing protein [Streptomyces palmae]TGA98048.1 lasso RiPP family leader peptide-containing protein [Streptomyces palmae]
MEQQTDEVEYETPALVEVGDFSELTLGSAGGFAESYTDFQ